MNTDTTPAPAAAPADPADRLRRLAERQGTLHTSTYERLLGACEHLWRTDEEFEAFLKVIETDRREPE